MALLIFSEFQNPAAFTFGVPFELAVEGRAVKELVIKNAASNEIESFLMSGV